MLTSPVVRCVKEQTNATIHYLTKSAFQDILEQNPYISKVFSFQKKLSEVIPALKEENYDIIIDLHKNLRSKQIQLSLQKPYKAFHKLNIAKWLMVNFKINQLPNKHIVDRYMETVQIIGVINDGKGLDYFIPKTEEWDAQTLKRQFPEVRTVNNIIAVAIGGAHFTKQIPSIKIIELAKQLIDRSPDCTIILLGGKEDEVKGASIKNRVDKKYIVNACGRLTLNQSASVVLHSKWVITADTGMMHIAAALGKNIISIWGNTIPSFGMYPYLKHESQEHHLFQITNLDCRPCSKIGHKKCPKKHFRCMMDQKMEPIMDIILEI